MTYHESFLVRGGVVELEDGTVVLGVEVSVPQLAGLAHELILEVKVPILVLAIELKVFLLGHIVDSHDAVILLHRVVLESGRSKWNHLLEVVNLVDILSLVPDAIRLVNKDEILVL